MIFAVNSQHFEYEYEHRYAEHEHDERYCPLTTASMERSLEL